MHFDEGFTDEEVAGIDDYHYQNKEYKAANNSLMLIRNSEREREELAFRLLASLPRARLATIQRRIAPLLQFDVVGALPTELSLQIFSHLTWQALLKCAMVSHRWQTLANDPFLWKYLCYVRGWAWRQPSRARGFEVLLSQGVESWDISDDEGMGDSDEEDDADILDDSGIASTSTSLPFPHPPRRPRHKKPPRIRHSAPSILPSTLLTSASTTPKINYKLLHQTHIRLHNRFLHASYRLTALQTRGAPTNGHTNTIYCLQLYTYPDTGVQVLFTGSRDRTIREWNLATGNVDRVISGVHTSSVLSLCVANGFVASAGSDRTVAVWDLEKDELVKVIMDHEDSVLCVRFDEERLVSCSKDRTVRTYTFPDLKPKFVLGAHRAAVNAVSISKNLIVSGSGDRSVRLWDAQTGKLLRTLENHHTRGIASIDLRPPFVLSGSSDKHLRLFDLTSLKGWSTSDLTTTEPAVLVGGEDNTHTDHHPTTICSTCGSSSGGAGPSATPANHHPEAESSGVTEGRFGCVHGDLVRTVALGEDLVVSGSYDLTIKVWNRQTGALVADLSGGHTGRIFCVGFDATKIVSCGEDQRICIWDFAHGIDTTFLAL